MAKNYVSEMEHDPKNTLQAIEGIGPSYAEALYKIGVHNFSDLAKYDSPADIRQDLTEKACINVPLWKIENKKGEQGSWLHQAREKEKDFDKKHQPTKEMVVSSNDEWKEFVAFIVSFESKNNDNGERVWQTRTYRTENGEEVVFPGVEPEAWVNWIYEQAQLPTTLRKVPKEIVELKIIDVELQEDPLSNILERKLLAEVHFEISGLETSNLTEQKSPFLIEMWLIELDKMSGRKVAVIDGRFVPNTLTYTKESIFDTPPPGRYELHTILLLRPPNEKLVTFTGPIINIVPEPLNLEAVTV